MQTHSRIVSLPNRLVVTVPTIPERSELANPLFEKLSTYLPGSAKLYQDVDRSILLGHAKCWFDNLHQGRLRGMRWSGVMQDDAILPDDFVERLQSILDEAEVQGRYVIKLYSNYFQDLEELKKGKRWRTIKGKTFQGEVFMVMDNRIVSMYQDFFERTDLSTWDTHWSDSFLAEFFKAYNIDVHIVLPNLVDHANTKSTVGHSSRVGGIDRVSRTFGHKGEQ